MKQRKREKARVSWEIHDICEEILERMHEEACSYTIQDSCEIMNDHGNEERKELNEKIKEYLAKGGKVKRHPTVFSKGGWTFNLNAIRQV